MPEIDNLVQEKVQVFSGQKSALTHAASENSDCEGIENFITRRSRLRKIWGASLYHTAGFGAGRVKWLDHFRNRWLFQRGDGIALETEEDSGEFNQLGTIEGSLERRVFSDKWIDSVFLSNGYQNKYVDFLTYNEPKLLNLGLLPPGGASMPNQPVPFPPATFTVQVEPGSDLPAGDFEYILTLWDDDRQVESMPYGSYVGEDGLWTYDSTILSGSTVDLANFTTGSGLQINVPGAGNKLAIDVSAILARGYDAQRVTHYIIYRKAADGVYKRVFTNQFLEIDITPINQPVFYDTIATADLGEVIDLSKSPPPSGGYYRDESALVWKDYGPRFVKYHRDQLWLFGVRFPGTPNGYINGRPILASRFHALNGRAYASHVGQFDFFGTTTFDVGRETGEDDTYLGKHRNTLMFFKEKSSYYLDGTSPENYEIRELDKNRGITVSGSAQETTAGIIGLGLGGFTLFSSVGPAEIISEGIADMVEQINLDQAHQIASAYDPEEEKYECHCPILNSYNTLVFIYDLKQKAWTFTKRAGGAAHYSLKSDKRSVGLIGDKQNGRLFLSTNRAAVTQAGQALHGVWRSKQFDWGRPGEIKTLQMITIVARAKRDFRLSIDVIPDFAQKDAASIRDIDPDVRDDNYAEDENEEGAEVWNEAQWQAGTVRKEFTVIDLGVAGKKIQLILRNSDTDVGRAQFEIEEIILHATLEEGEDDA